MRNKFAYKLCKAGIKFKTVSQENKLRTYKELLTKVNLIWLQTISSSIAGWKQMLIYTNLKMSTFGFSSKIFGIVTILVLNTNKRSQGQPADYYKSLFNKQGVVL